MLVTLYIKMASGFYASIVPIKAAPANVACLEPDPR